MMDRNNGEIPSINGSGRGSNGSNNFGAGRGSNVSNGVIPIINGAGRGSNGSNGLVTNNVSNRLVTNNNVSNNNVSNNNGAASGSNISNVVVSRDFHARPLQVLHERARRIPAEGGDAPFFDLTPLQRQDVVRSALQHGLSLVLSVEQDGVIVPRY
jgi:hypothetical protein